jgi:hypothetical protein
MNKMTNKTTLHLDEELKPVWDRLLSFIPEPPEHFNRKEAQYWYALCDMMKDRNQLTHRHTLYIANICKTVAEIESDPKYFGKQVNKNWKPEYNYKYETLKKMERNLEYDSLSMVAHFVGLTISDLKAAGLPIQKIFRNR